MKPVIWVLTAGFGDGHNTAARSIAAALSRLDDSPRVAVRDCILQTHPWLGFAAMRAYAGVIVHAPWIWKRLYDDFARTADRALHNPLLDPLKRSLADALKRERPSVIVSTYPLYASLLESLKAQGLPVPAVITVVTDSVSIHPTWRVGWSDLYLVADEESRAVMLGMGTPAERVEVTGFPVSPAFTTAVERLPSRAGRILYLPSTSTSHVRGTLQELAPLVADGAELTVVPGRHAQRLHQTLRSFADQMEHRGNVEVLGWCDRIPDLLREHDVIICKAGGAMLHEVMAGCRPAVVDWIVPGQEEGNAQMLLSVGGGVLSASPADTAAHVQRLLADGQSEARRMSAAMQAHSRPDAALRAAQIALRHLSLPLSP